MADEHGSRSRQAQAPPPPAFYIIPVARISSRDLLVRKGGSLRRKELGVYCYLLRHPSQGTILIDTGYPALTASDPSRYPGFPASMLMKITMARGDEVSGKIQRIGIRPEDVSMVLFTHLHVDHMGDTQAFSSARILVHSKEWDTAFKKGRRHGFRPDFLAPIVPETFDFPARPAYGPFETSIDVLGDGSIVAVPTPGHTAGHVSYMVQAGEKSFFLTGDAAWVEENYTVPSRKGLFAHLLVEEDRGAQRDSLARVHSLYKSRPDVCFLSGHDGRLLNDPRLAPHIVR